MSIEKNVEVVKNFLAALGRRDKQGLLALSAEDIEWIIPGEDWPLAGTHRGHAGLADLLQKANETVETSYPEPPEFIAQGDRVLVVGFATGRIKATNKTFEDHWVFAITVRNGKLTNVREYIDTLALARASVATQRNGYPSAFEGRGININTDRRTIMSYAIVGFGKIGQALAHAFARKNINVTVASRRPPEELAPQARAIGPTVVAKSLRDALEADAKHLVERAKYEWDSATGQPLGVSCGT